MTDFVVYDVFTDAPFGGNPLAVIPDARRLAEGDLMRITREFNFSETTFVYPSESCDARVRIFTPGSELAFAGHPTVGTAVALAALGRAPSEMVLELGVGPIPVTVNGTHARFETRVPLEVGEAPGVAEVAACLGLPEDAIKTANHAPVSAGLGTDFVLVEIADRAALLAAAPSLDDFRRVEDRGAMRLGIFLYVRAGDAIDARMFAPLGGIMEDPATGSASAALAAYLGRLDGTSQTFSIRQGVDMGRPSAITAEVVVAGGTPEMVAISGNAVRVMEGRLTL
ncbi:MAG: PhzF family phenazine biosynthesis protein [Pseudomonadota bacterium]